MTHIMLDLETWGKTPGCDTRSIGACVFDPVAGTVAKSREFPESERQFYAATDNPAHPGPDADFSGWHFDYTSGEYRKYPLARDPETVQWWNDQSAEAQAAFADPVDLWKACYEFRYWIWQNNQPTERFENWAPGETVRVWANDPHFDVSILEAVYHAVDLPVPWHYRAPRSMKTVCDLAGITRDDMAAFSHGTAHHALDDAISQAMIVCEAYKRLGLQK